MASKEFKTDIDLNGYTIIKGGFNNFDTLPTTFEGRQITYAGKVYSWNGTKYVNNENYFAETSPSDTAGRWTANIPGITELYDGLQIKIVLKTSYNSTYNTLNVNGLGQTLVWYRVGSRLSSHLPVNSILSLTYYSGAGTYSTFTGGWVISASYYADTVTENAVSQFRPIAGEAIGAYKLGMLGLDDKFYPFTKESTTGATKTVQTNKFKLNSPIFYNISSASIGAAISTLRTMAYFSTLLYSLNQNFEGGVDLFLKGQANVEDNSFTLDNSSYTSWCTDTLPTTDDGFDYIYLGKTYSTGSYMHLFEWHPIYYFKDGALRILNTAYVVDNLTSVLTNVSLSANQGRVLKALIDSLQTSSHTHGNKAILDSISAAFTTSLKAFYDGAVSNSHTHSNKAILDAVSAAFTTALKSNYDTAYNNSHTHSNKAILDAISASFTTALKASYDGAVTSSHTHSNKTILDAITAAFTTELKTKLENLSDGGWVQYVEDSPLTKKYIPFDNVTAFGWKSGSGLIITMYQRYGTNAFGVSDSYDCMELFECSYSTPNKTDIDEGVIYPNPVNQAKIAKRNIWTDSPDVAKYKHKLTEGIFGSIGTFPANNSLSTWLNTTSNGVAGYALKNNSSIFTDLSGGTAYYLNLTQIVANMKMGMNYTFVGRAVGAGVVTFELVDSRGSASTNLTIGQIVSFDFVRIATGIVLYRNFEVR